jgi:hypothetical protein
VVDGPGSDWPVPDPLPHGWQILTPDAGPPYAEDLTVVWLAMHHQTDGLQGRKPGSPRTELHDGHGRPPPSFPLIALRANHTAP